MRKEASMKLLQKEIAFLEKVKLQTEKYIRGNDTGSKIMEAQANRLKSQINDLKQELKQHSKRKKKGSK